MNDSLRSTELQRCRSRYVWLTRLKATLPVRRKTIERANSRCDSFIRITMMSPTVGFQSWTCNFHWPGYIDPKCMISVNPFPFHVRSIFNSATRFKQNDIISNIGHIQILKIFDHCASFEGKKVTSDCVRASLRSLFYSEMVCQLGCIAVFDVSYL